MLYGLFTRDSRQTCARTYTERRTLSPSLGGVLGTAVFDFKIRGIKPKASAGECAPESRRFIDSPALSLGLRAAKWIVPNPQRATVPAEQL